MNYRHAFHAGNFADVVKHLALVCLLLHLKKKDGGFCAIDSHAGRGAYDLTGEAARRTGEAELGIKRLAGLDAASQSLKTYLDLSGGPLYPGSPLLCARLLRPQDRLVAIERHTDDFAALRETLHPFARAKAEEGDGYRRLAALLPPPERRGLVLIDPPFEAEDEFQQAATAFAAAYRRFATGHYLIWFPIKSAAEANGFCGEVLAAGPAKVLRLDVSLAAAAEGKLVAAGLLIVNPPWQFDSQMRQALEPVLPRLGASIRLDWLAGEP